ncbi:hypothetical protein [Actinomadura alba]|uniref:Uncharacterized protein n=1 Tax=Actinomadura alba TaxID=406431 RepID=A0ABR7LHF3_9ACTN|nr:hypothetical protein [Actinomadura alba]MBC6464272.1 hypothetical protein [Actinomadura alba]
MKGTADRLAVALDVHELTRPGGILDQLDALLPEQVTDPTTGGTSGQKTTGSPAPWHAEAAAVLVTIHEEARRLEASLRREVTGRLGRRRGGSDGNTREALAAIVNLTEAVCEDEVKRAARIVARWVTSARQIRDIDQADRWEPLPRLPGHLPPACDWCSTYSLRMNRRTGEVRCTNHRCTDEEGRRPYARILAGSYSGQTSLVWQDSRSVVYVTEEPAA